MPYFPTWFFWESDKKIAAYCKKVEEERLVHTKIAEDKEISAEQTIRKIYNKLSQEECVFLKDAFGVKF
jgi:chromatin segregation and condensation protein Rec8/ScpA/Scc1 (kleisin family)